ncbi:MAG: hypothetical protein JRN20_19065 [Nitrososphaerota archaeon]|nr:hypothetical protein [Nitrososphaerota archaeon]
MNERKSAISVTAGVIILLASVAGVLGVFFVSNVVSCFSCGAPNYSEPSITGESFNATSNTFKFTVHNATPHSAMISLVEVDQLPCNGNLPIIDKGATVSSSCIITGASIDKGQNVSYVLNFANELSDSGVVTAQ